MSGLGSTVDTDLVGELVEVFSRYDECYDGRPKKVPVEKWPIARGRVRAVTASTDGDLTLFLHLEDEECVGRSKYSHDDAALHDVICIAGFQTKDNLLRLMKGGVKP